LTPVLDEEGNSVSGEDGDPLMEGSCLGVLAKGDVEMTGHSVITTAPVNSLVPGAGTTQTPICFAGDPTRGCGVPGQPENTPPPTAAGLNGFTSRAKIAGTVRERPWSTRYEGEVYTRDSGYITPDGFVGQILLVEKGTGDLADSSGRIGVAGQEVGGFAIYRGEVCVRQP
jgi:hypothetical protein